MTFTALDTHQTVKDLTAAGFSDSQAEALTQALRQVQQIDLSDLATKADLAAVRADMATKADLAAVRADMATKADLAAVRADMATKVDLAEVRREMAEMKVELIKWVVGVGFAQVATILAVLKLFPAGHP